MARPMTKDEAKQARRLLGLTYRDISEQMGALTGRTYSQGTVSNWFSRDLTDAFVIFLHWKLSEAGIAYPFTEVDVSA